MSGVTAGLQTCRKPAPPQVSVPASARGQRLQRKCACGGKAEIEGKCEECQRKGLGLHRLAAASTPAVAPPIVHAVLRSPGQQLDRATRAFMEPRFGHDFSRVQVHADGRATQSALAVDALAYTVGKHIVFQTEKLNASSQEGKALIAHELAHVVQQEAESVDALPSSLRLDDSSSSGAEEQAQRDATTVLGGLSRLVPTGGVKTQQPMLQRQRTEKSQTEQTASSTSSGAPTVTAVPGAFPTAQPGSQWSPEVPYIHFDLLDFYRSLYNPAGPYFYSSYVGLNRADNPNFSKDLNPAPARDTSTVTPNGWYAKPYDLNWVFATKFYVDSAAAPLPKEFTEFETKADIKFVPTSGGTGFEDHFANPPPSPQYTPPLPSSAFYLTTKPYVFRAEHPIMESGTLQWDAKLRIAKADADVPLQLEYSALPDCPDASAFKSELERLGTRIKEPAPGEKARVIRLEISKKAGGIVGTYVVVDPDGATFSRTIDGDGSSCEVVIKALALTLAIAFDPVFSQGRSGISKSGLLQINGAQRVKFEPPKATP